MLTKMISTGTEQNKLASIYRRNPVSKAVINSYKAFSTQYPEWEAALFDEYFFNTRVAPMVKTAIKNGEFVRVEDITDQWADQFSLLPSTREEVIPELQHVVNKCLQMIKKELIN